MNWIRRFLFGAFYAVILSQSSYGQGTFHDTTYSHAHDFSEVQGSDFYFAPPQIFANAGEYYQLNITSPKNTTVHIQTGTIASTISVKAGQTANYSLPLTQVIKTSSIVEDKGYHVWSDSAVLDVMLVVDYSIDSAGDAIHILPDLQLGKDYVVAAYGAYFVGSESLEYDYPSMFTVAAAHDSTFVQVTSSADLRMETETTPNPTGVAHSKGHPFTVRLDRGQSIQFKTVLPQDPLNYDVTGTTIHSNYPVAVIGASERAAIPSDHITHPDFVADMIPPIRAWDTLYYTQPFYQPNGVLGHNASSFAVIGTVPNQSIYTTDETGEHLFAALDHAYDVSLQPNVELATRWHSSAPFMLVQYANAADYPTATPGALGSPAMMIVPPVARFAHSATVQLPIYNGTYATQFSTFMNVIADPNASFVTMDGTNIRNWPKTTLPDGTIIYRNAPGSLIMGAHVLSSDAPVGATMYGYSTHSGETIAYPAETGLVAPASTDAIAPHVTWSENGICATALLTDSGSGLSHIEIDSFQNISISRDTGFAAGDSIRSTELQACILDTTANGFVKFTAYDMAGNRTTGELSYTAPAKILLKPGYTVQAMSFDTCRVGTSKLLGAVTISDTSSYWPLAVDSIWIDNSVFTDTATGDTFPFTISPNSAHTLQILFTPTQDLSYTSLVHIQTTSAGTQSVQVRGVGYSTDGVTTPSSAFAEWLASGTGETMLLPPAPNPASREITLTYALRTPAAVVFLLFNESGAELYHHTFGTQASGMHTAMLDLPNLPAGSCFFRFEANGEQHSGTLEIR